LEYPALVISHDLTKIFQNLRNMGLKINLCENAQEVRDFIKLYNGVVLDTPIVLSDISDFAGSQGLLLKFVEESESPLLFLSSSDCIFGTLLSRFRTVVKYPKIIKNQKDSISLISDKLFQNSDDPEKGITTEDIIEYAPSAYPILQYLNKSDLPVKHKIKRLLFT
jgi:hypothetical protein